ncbi:MAG: S-adenosylmethionine:tRNA ribosyltransferase-isomerase [Chloroflexi bacterium]|nr:S-adenosylmethionine:tRNA ribosyltransferase-isomerase [Chloroflexota bacterium]
MLYVADMSPVTIDFTLPPELEASEPPEVRGLRRDDVRLMVSHYDDDRIEHHTFHELDHVLQRGDVLIINTSGTLNAALAAIHPDGHMMRLHLSTQLDRTQQRWVVEVRQLREKSTDPFFEAVAGQVYRLPDGATAELLTPYAAPENGKTRLWLTQLDWNGTSFDTYLSEHGSPIRYSYVERAYGSEYYQTVFANEMGSAEMPSAGRAFTPELVTRLVARGIQFAPILLHTGVASLEADERPYSEYYRVSPETADLINAARRANRRIIAVGTTSARAIETVADKAGFVQAGEDWTELVITPERGVFVVDGILTGFHEPRASHLDMLAAIAGHQHINLTYRTALQERYLWHEFGDLHLILP